MLVQALPSGSVDESRRRAGAAKPFRTAAPRAHALRADSVASPAFTDRSTVPDDAALTRHLGKSKQAWEAILDHVHHHCAGVALDWKFYGQND